MGAACKGSWIQAYRQVFVSRRLSKIDRLEFTLPLPCPLTFSLSAGGQCATNLYQVTNDIFTREDAEFLTKNSALEEGR